MQGSVSSDSHSGSVVKKPTIVDQYLGWVDKYTKIYGEKCIVFVENGTFMELYANRCDVDSAAHLKVAHELLEIRVTYGDKNDPKSHAMAGVTKSVRKKHYKVLLKNFYTIVEAMQVTDPKDGPCQREVVNIISPGCNVDDMEENTTYTHIISVFIEVDSDNDTFIYVSCFNCSLGTSSLQVVPQDDTEYNASIDRLNEIICNIEYKEILINYSCLANADSDTEKRHKAILLGNTDFETKLFHWKRIDLQYLNHWKTQRYQEEYLEDFFSHYNKTGLGVSILDCLDLAQIDSISIMNYIILLEFVKNHNAILLKNIHRPQPLALCQSDNLETYNSCYEKLNIFNAKDSRYTLFKFLNKTCTKSGSRLFRGILSRPFIDPEQIETRYNIVDAFFHSADLLNGIRQRLEIVDLERIHRRLSVNKLPPFEIPKLVQALENIYDIFKLIRLHSSKVLIQLLPSEEIINDVSCFMKDLKTSFDLDLCKKHSLANIDENIFQGGVSPKLDNIASKLQTKHSNLSYIAKVLTAISQKIYLHDSSCSAHGYDAKSQVSELGKKPTKQELDLWINDNYILEFDIQRNPRKPGGDPYKRYNIYKTATTYQEFEILGGSRKDLENDIMKKVLKVYKPNEHNGKSNSNLNLPKLDLTSDYPLTIQVKNTEKEGYCLDTTSRRMEALKHEIKQLLKYSPEFSISIEPGFSMDLGGIKYDTRTSRPKISSEAIKTLSDDILKLQIDLKETIQSEYLKLTEELCRKKYIKSFEVLIKAVNYIDVYTTFAFLVSLYGLTRPKIEKNNDLIASHVRFEDLRNIIVEKILKIKENFTFLIVWKCQKIIAICFLVLILLGKVVF